MLIGVYRGPFIVQNYVLYMKDKLPTKEKSEEGLTKIWASRPGSEGGHGAHQGGGGLDTKSRDKRRDQGLCRGSLNINIWRIHFLKKGAHMNTHEAHISRGTKYSTANYKVPICHLFHKVLSKGYIQIHMKSLNYEIW